MKKTPQKITDFFDLYRIREMKKILLSGSFALMIAFSIVGIVHGNWNMNGLMASVANINTESRLEADLIMIRHGESLTFTFGATAKKIEYIEFSLLSDPERFRAIQNADPNITVTQQQEIGMYHIRINMHGRDITPGTQVAKFTIDMDSDVSVALIDTEFISEGNRYHLTSKGE